MIFSRSIQNELWQNALATFVAVFGILISTVLIRTLAQAAGGSVPAEAVLALIGFSSLAQMPVVVSLTMFIAVLTVVTRSYRDSEMVVWLASGLPLWSWFRPVLNFALPWIILTVACSFLFSPWAQQERVIYTKTVSNQDDVNRVAPGIFRESANGDRVLFVEESPQKMIAGARMSKLFLRGSINGRQGIVVAKEAYLHVDPEGRRFLVLLNGQRYEGQPGEQNFRIIKFAKYQALINKTRTVVTDFRPREVATKDLLKRKDNAAIGELIGRLSTPIAALLLVVLAIPLAFANPRMGKTGSMIFAFLLFLTYYNGMSITQSWVSEGKMSPLAGLFAPHVFILLIILVLFGHRLQLLRAFKAWSA